MNNNRKYKRPKHNTLSTTNPESSKPRIRKHVDQQSREPLCPLAAKDSEWVDILQSTSTESDRSATNISDEEEVLQLVECEDGPQMKPLAIMFPGLLQKDPVTLQGMLNKAMSTTEVTRHLVDLGEKANFTFMKTADRLIPREKQWLESLTENSDSFTSMATMASSFFNSSFSSDFDADKEVVYSNNKKIRNVEENIANTSAGDSYSEDELFVNMKEMISEILKEIRFSKNINKDETHN